VAWYVDRVLPRITDVVLLGALARELRRTQGIVGELRDRLHR